MNNYMEIEANIKAATKALHICRTLYSDEEYLNVLNYYSHRISMWMKHDEETKTLDKMLD